MQASINLEEDLFAAAMALPPQERARYLQRACGKNRELLERVESLLANVDSAASFMNSTQWGVAAPPSPLQNTEPDTFGPYKQLYEIGEGGCGVVYMAEQETPVRREVALKIIKLGMDTKAVIARFRAEQQVLARMDHPNIAKVLDAGVTSAGRPYFAMELVRGIKMTKYCDQSALSIAERLALFTQICHAIQHAHYNGVVHRDIKPSNVLVTLHDGVPMVKVIDFGIAKAMQGRLSDHTLYTALDQFLGTPAYVSPEQLDSSLGEVDFRSDIYSLGVLLYELLTGCTPVSVPTTYGHNLDEFRNRLRTQEPLRPSRKLRSLPCETHAAALCRQTTADKLIETISGDLDWIVMRCLEKDRKRRYPSAAELAEDIQRFLSSEPIVARPPSTLYTLRKLAERHRPLFVASASVMVILMIATTVSTWFAVRAYRADKIAQAEAAVQRELADFLSNDLLAQASPEQEPDRDIDLRTVLDRAAQSIPGHFLEQPLVEASIRTTLADTYLSLGEYAAAEDHYKRALVLYQREMGASAAKTLYVSRKIVRVLSDRALYDQAEEFARKALAAHQESLGAEHEDTLEAMHLLAIPLFMKGERAAATRLLTTTLEGCQRLLGNQHPKTQSVMNELAFFYLHDRKPELAQPLLTQVLEIRKRTYGERHPATITVMSNLAGAYAEMNKLGDAEPLMIQSLELRREILGVDHPSTLTSLNNLATLYSDQGRMAESSQLLSLCIELGQRRLGESHPRVLVWMTNLGKNRLEENQLDSAYEILKRTLDLRQATLGAKHPDTLMSMSNLGLVEHRRGHLAQAETLSIRAWEDSDAVSEIKSPLRLTIGDRLAAILVDRKKFAAAEPLLRTVSEARKKKSPNDWSTFATLARLGDVLIRMGRYAEAEPLLVDALRGLMQQEHNIPRSQRAVLETTSASMRKLYVAWNRPEGHSHQKN